MTTRLGVLGFGALATVDERGAVATGDLTVDWWVGADDRWHVPADEASTHQQRVAAAPVIETTVRVPGGEVAHTVYGVALAAGAGVVVEVENRSPAPLTVALVVRVGVPGRIEFNGSVLRSDGVPLLVVSRAPGAWSSGAWSSEGWSSGASTAATVMAGDARPAPVESCEGPIELALLFPVPHRTRIRAALGDLGSDITGPVPIDLRNLADAGAVVRGWERQLDRGMQAQVPGAAGERVDAARADLLLAPRDDAQVFAALEDWGFDAEAEGAWSALGFTARRRARRRVETADPWRAATVADAGRDPAGFLSALRAVLVRESDPTIDLLPGFPPDWLGQSLTVDTVPLRAGPLSFAVRWHGARPALLWDAPPGVELRVPALDPAWSSREPAGETLLAEPPAPLLPMGTRERSAGEPVDAPGQFT